MYQGHPQSQLVCRLSDTTGHLTHFWFLSSSSLASTSCVSCSSSRTLASRSSSACSCCCFWGRGRGCVSSTMVHTKTLPVLFVRDSCVHSHIHVQMTYTVYASKRMYACTLTHTHTHAHAHARTHARTHTHTQYQGRIEPPKAARGHATSDSAYMDGIVLSVAKNSICARKICRYT